MCIYKNYILPIGINWLLGRPECLQLRKSVTGNLTGTVLEVGFGSGLNLPYYPNCVERVYAVDPCGFGKRLASKRIHESSIPVDFVGLNGENIPLETNSVSAALSTWTLCTIPDVRKALKEIRRVLKPDAKFYFLEHGLSADVNVAKWQNRLNPIQKIIAGGCQLNLKINRLIEDAGFSIDSIENFYMEGPKVGSYMYKGQCC
ncbi:MAG: class I SAM-dependent methyltransferase [Candidatus Anammoxibacter sp.]